VRSHSLRHFAAWVALFLGAVALRAGAPDWWSEQGAVAPTGLTGQYFDNVDFTSPVTPPATGTVATPTATRVDAGVNFAWGTGAPHPALAPGSYSVRWTGQIQPRYSEAYTFSATSNDGVRVWINGTLIIDHWAAHEESDRVSAPIALTANQRYDIRVDYYQSTGSATVVLRWASVSQSLEVVPRTVLSPNNAALGVRNDYAAVNLGQVKNIAAKAVDEMNAKLPGGAGTELNEMVAAWRLSTAPAGVVRNDYAAVNQGQLKALAKKFYERLAAANYQGPPTRAAGEPYPWTANTADDRNFAAVNIGQVKYLFSFVPSLANDQADTDGDGLANKWERDHGKDPLVADARFSDLGDPTGSNGWTYLAQQNLTITPSAAGTAGGTGSLPQQTTTNGIVGATTGSLQVDKSGAATYSVPLWVAPGTAGMQPQLSLNYSSQGGAGWLGYGWSLGGISAISRGGRTIAGGDGVNRGVTFTSDDRLYLDGQRLVLVSSDKSYGEDGAEYRTEIDSISKVISYRATGPNRNGPDSFKVWTKAGLIIEFGTINNSAFQAQGRDDGLITTWSVAKISDTKGNYMTFTYANDNEHALERIDYTGNGSANLTPYASVRFGYEARTDTFSGYQLGSLISRTKRLKTVSSYYGDTLTRKYVLGYNDTEQIRPNTGRSLLIQLDEQDGAGRAFAQPLKFEFESTQAGWQQPDNAKWGAPVAVAVKDEKPRGTGFIDLNGDGRPDFVKHHRRSGPVLPPPVTPSTQGLSAAYYHYTPNPDGSVPLNPFSSAPVVTRIDQNINSTSIWGTEAPVPGVNANNFAVRWRGQIRPLYTGIYTFTVTSDDGVKLFINDQQVIANWTYHAPTADSGSIYLEAGQKYDLALEYFQGEGDKMAVLEWESEPTDWEQPDYQVREVVPNSALFAASSVVDVGTGTGLTGTYYNGQNFDAQILTRLDEVIDMDWGGDSPGQNVSADSFSVRWSGWIEPRYSENYTFIVTSDDGVRLKINGQSLLPSTSWQDGAAREHIGTISLAAGQRYSIEMEFYENGGAAVAKLEWQSARQSRVVVPKLQLYPASSDGSGGTLPPLVSTPNTADVAAWINDPVNGWVPADGTVTGVPNFKPPAPLANDNDVIGDTGSRFADVNGDGVPEFFGRADSVFQFYRHNGSNWAHDPARDLPLPPGPAGFEAGTITGIKNATFIDLDGDGRVDFLARVSYYYRDESENLPNESHTDELNVWRNTGTGWEINDNLAPPLPLEQGSRFMDVNGDGLVDQVQNWYGHDATIKAVALNTGTGWRKVFKNQTNDPDNNMEVEGGSRFVPPLRLNTADPTYGENAPLGTEVVDLNGDGLSDIVARNSGNLDYTYAAYFNTGNGWTLAPLAPLEPPPEGEPPYEGPNYGPHFALANNHELQGAAFLDVNGDGLPDLLQATEDTTRHAYLNTGRGWGNDIAAHHLLRQLKHGRLPNVGTDFVDLNADGLVDQVWGYQESLSGPLLKGAAYNTSRSSDRLLKVTNGFGVEATVAYAPLTERDASGAYTVYTKGGAVPDPEVVNVIGPMYVVKSVMHQDGAGGNYSINYRYAGLRSHRERGSLGFESIETIDTRTGIYSKTTHSQAYPHIGMPVASVTKTSASGDAKTLSESFVSYATRSLNDGKTKLPYASSTVETSHDLDGTTLVTTTTTVGGMDDYGNVTSMTVATSDGFSKTTTSAYSNDAAKWFLGRLMKSTVVSKATGQSDLTRTSAFLYDAGTGLLTDEAVEPALNTDGQLIAEPTNASGYGALTLRTTYGYDPFGNKTSVTVRGLKIDSIAANGTVTYGTTLEARSTSSTYDAKGRLPLTTSNALSHTETYSYAKDAGDPTELAADFYLAFGVARRLTGPNGLATSWTYDSFGRKIGEQRADGTATTILNALVPLDSPTLPAGANFTTRPAVATATPTPHHYVETSATGAPPARTYYDNFGREILSLTLNGDGDVIFQNTLYDDRSRVVAKSNPYRSGDTVYYATTEEFDLLNRPLKVRTPADETAKSGTDTQGRHYAETGFSYSGFTTTATDPQGRKSVSVKDAQGRTVTNTRNSTAAGDATASTVRYSYDALGDLLGTTTPGDTANATVTTTLAYDNRGRKLTMTDEDMGTWLYRYNAFGELVWQKDAKGQIVTLAYDALGRMTKRVEYVSPTEFPDRTTPEGTTEWTYDTSPRGSATWQGKLHNVSATYTHTSGSTATENYTETYTYDSNGRPLTVSRSLPGLAAALETSQTYDTAGRPDVLSYPGGFKVKNYYNAYGYLRSIRREDDSFKQIYWIADAYDASGRVTHEFYGNGLDISHSYSAATGRLGLSRVGISQTGQQVQFLSYTYDTIGNVLTRADASTGRTESFSYDGLDRLRSHVLAGGTAFAAATVDVTYRASGNIASKSDAGTYAYGTAAGPHAVTAITGTGALAGRNFLYDGVGNQTHRRVGTGEQALVDRAQTWTSFNQVRRVETYDVPGQTGAAGKFSEFAFGAGHERVRQISNLGTTHYVGGLFERFTPAGPRAVTEDKFYIAGPTGRVAVHVRRTDGSRETRWFHSDGLGSITGVTDEAGRAVQRFAFDAWGKRVHATTGAVVTGASAGGFTRGYTGHEQLDDLGLVHMNGRVYDPVLGRFLSADPNVDDATDAQGFNRYSYVGNNPMNATDPSGYFSLKDALKIAVVVVAAVVTAGVAVYGAAMLAGQAITLGNAFAAIAGVGGWSLTGYGAVVAGAGAGFASGFAGSLLNGGSIGDAFKAGVIGGIVGGISAGIAHGIGDFAANHEWFRGPLQHLSHGVAQGAITEATGGEFRHGFYAAAFTSALGGPIGSVGEKFGVAGEVAAAAVVGGTASAIGGGKFANGAASGAFTYLFNHANHKDSEQKTYREAQDVMRKLKRIHVANPDKPIFLTDGDLEKIMLADKARAASEGWDKLSAKQFYDKIQGAGGDGMLYREFGRTNFILSDGRTVPGGDINYYYQGFVHAARGTSPMRFALERDATIGGWNVKQFVMGEGMHNLKQIGPAAKWANTGYEFYRKH